MNLKKKIEKKFKKIIQKLFILLYGKINIQKKDNNLKIKIKKFLKFQLIIKDIKQIIIYMKLKMQEFIQI
jgi:hypothetical protein